MEVHPIKPIYNEKSKILILGSFPSVKSREECFFYAHPANRFWRVIAKICGEGVPKTIEEKTRLILGNNFAVWDVIHSCEIVGSSDSSIKNVQPNDLTMLIKNSEIKHIFVNGKKAEALYNKYLREQTGIDGVVLPSTSPANAAWSEEKLAEYWQRAISAALNTQ